MMETEPFMLTGPDPDEEEMAAANEPVPDDDGEPETIADPSQDTMEF